jgi:hypothetical protein
MARVNPRQNFAGTGTPLRVDARQARSFRLRPGQCYIADADVESSRPVGGEPPDSAVKRARSRLVSGATASSCLIHPGPIPTDAGNRLRMHRIGGVLDADEPFHVDMRDHPGPRNISMNEAKAMPTTSLGFALAFFVAAFVSTIVGLAFREYLADRLRLDHARDMVGGVTGLVVTLVALVFGLLIWTAFGVFSTQKTELQVMAANALEFNQETREYGPEAAHARALMRADMDWAHKQLWGDDQAKVAAMAASVRNMDSLSVALDHLEPATEAQKSLLADAKRNYAAIWQNRILMALQGIDAVSWPTLYFVSIWTCIAFFLTGLNSKSGAATIAVAALGSFCVASAMFLILELSQPYSSAIRVSSDGIDRVGLELDKP